ncbi:hypothetical protein OG373_34815 [Streptomyces avidinii]|uniref:hypothetical protein n=1 Tax=Streptomyces avidinii TaxID=1895 RepID=UPI00386C673F|nr:hypothetical protein OG373_34815 [Streptomyces avidinii]
MSRRPSWLYEGARVLDPAKDREGIIQFIGQWEDPQTRRVIPEAVFLRPDGGTPRLLSGSAAFFDEPCYPTFGQRPQGFPRVYANPGTASKRRYSTDGAMCRWYPYDPEERRWTSPKGLLHLFEIVRTHLFLEHCWRLTGGENGGEWLIEYAPHGLPRSSTWVPASSSRPRRRRAAGREPRPPL